MYSCGFIRFSVKGFTGGFDTANRYDESKYAKIVAGHIGAEYHQIFPKAVDLENTFDDMIFHLDEPVAGAAVFPQYFLSKLASRHVKVVLGGQEVMNYFAVMPVSDWISRDLSAKGHIWECTVGWRFHIDRYRTKLVVFRWI